MQTNSKLSLHSLPQKYTVIAQMLTIAWLSSIVFLSLLAPDKNPVKPPFPHFDKLAHFIIYAGLEFSSLVSEHLRRSRKLNAKETAALTTIVLSIGGAIEFLQMTVGRNAEWMDMLANASGVFLALVLIGLIRKWFIADGMHHTLK